MPHLTSYTSNKYNLYLANSLTAAVSEPDLHRILAFHVPNLTTKLEDHALSPVRDVYSRPPSVLGGPGSSVGIATDYLLDGPGSNPGEDEIFRPSRPTLWLTQPPIKWVPGLSRG